MIFKGICKIDFDEDDDADEWGTALASASCLQAFAQAIKDEILTPVVTFVAEKIQNSADWKERYAGLVAFGSITEGPDRLKFADVLL